MPRNLDDLIAHGDALAAEFEQADREAFVPPSALSTIRLAAMRRSAAERQLRDAVLAGRREKISWENIGQALGTSGEAARKRYGRQLEDHSPATSPDRSDEGDRHPEGTWDVAHVGRGFTVQIVSSKSLEQDLVRLFEEDLVRDLTKKIRVGLQHSRPRVAGERRAPFERSHVGSARPDSFR